MRKYPKYKASGVDWLGEIPSDWIVSKVKFVSYNLDGSRIPLNQAERLEIQGEYPYYGATGIIDYINKYLIDGEFILVGEDGAPFTIPNRNVAFEAKGKVWVNNHAHIIKGKKNFLQTFITHSLNIVDYSKYVQGSTREKLTQSDLSNINLLAIPYTEQQAIVRFLDYKTEQIDSFIANRQKQIELLKEQKAGIINKAVTKGIDPNVKMKDSGIEWIGEVPEHWMIGKVRRVLNILTDFTANGSFADLAKNVKYLDTPDHSRLIRLTDLREDLKNEGIYVNKEAHKFLSKSELFGGEILMANVGAYAGLVCLVPKLDFIATLGPNMFLLKFDEKRMSNQFAFTLLGSDCYYKLLMNKALSSAQPKLNKEDVKSIDFIFPPTQEEQKAILDWIKEETSNVDALISKYQKQIDLMQEYRTSLISQAVTGKIDVREWQPKKQQTA